jgi:glycosyltransferase involved in cell wall biosynthesis
MNYVRSADVFVLPTLVDKTPSCLMEALALEVPCIASDIDGVRELITPGGGLLVAANNPHAMAEKITWVLEHPTEAREMGKIGRAFMIAEFQWKKTRESIKQLYWQLMDKKS